ncbi:MAG: NAD(P)(+) transhydrogenase (Re/Si-specific) subunit beta [Candidatus Thermoplasmatota archaeon]|nr:NAD(P)(+) transhydrogenase (Re/Si-specific) subunit beta [Candidatus Thermoplasmatota archaeon]
MVELDPAVVTLIYLVSAAFFILGLRDLGSPATARRGNLLASIGMLIAIVVTLLNTGVLNYELIAAGLLLGAVLGATAARLVKMTAMPQMVGLFNGFGGGASALVAIAAYFRGFSLGQLSLPTTVTILVGVLIGGITLTGSLVAFGKLQGVISGAPKTFPLQQPVNAALVVLYVGLGGYLVAMGIQLNLFLVLVAIALVLGVLIVIPIGGADMPVVISLLNSFSGLAASAAGFILGNEILIVAGALVGAAGLVLTRIMTKAMNRSLPNVLFGAVGVDTKGPGATAAVDKTVRSIDPEEAALLLGYAQSVIIVPGFGMAAAQAQHAVADLANKLEDRGVNVRYAIHPVAGRMPGHMNVLLAEANVPYTKLHDMDDINPDFERADVALIIGANDVVNPAARHDEGSPIYGMPILDADRAKHIIVMKRSLNPGFSGVDNELFYHERTMMLFGDARDKVMELVAEVKQL